MVIGQWESSQAAALSSSVLPAFRSSGEGFSMYQRGCDRSLKFQPRIEERIWKRKTFILKDAEGQNPSWTSPTSRDVCELWCGWGPIATHCGHWSLPSLGFWICKCSDRSLEADSMGFAQSHPVSGSLLMSDPGVPPASPGCPSPGRRGKEKGKNCVWGQVMQQGHLALSDLTFSTEDTLSTFARLRSCLLFRTYFGNYPPSLMPQHWELPAGAEGHL
ncbi:uncharacterized protein LOC117796097 [Ailuropoda melanoleuca]|uniref:uncharacterized protein LOC117796097 n=1 Tax=Ailuropoda melanoleuca TaxID=9646 RepID=UPI0014943D9A|nr:uncharacterized protein LOC117796097 [Ailuropoda melanoleuca]